MAPVKVVPAPQEAPANALGHSMLARLPTASAFVGVVRVALFPIEWSLYRLPLHIVMTVLLVAAVLVDYPRVIFRQGCLKGFVHTIFFPLYFPLLALGVAFGAYNELLADEGTTFHFPLAQTVVMYAPWPQGRDAKVRALATSRRVDALQRMLQFRQVEENAEVAARAKATRKLRAKLDTQCNDDDDHLNAIKEAGEVNLECPDASGNTFLGEMAGYGYSAAVKLLLERGADPNVQDGDGHTALHNCLDGWNNLEAEVRPVVTRLLDDPRTDPCLYSEYGTTPYMMVKEKKRVELMRPKINFQAVEAKLKEATEPGQAAAHLRSLIPSGGQLHALRIPDLLFCEHEGDHEELKRRRRAWWDLLLKPMMEEAARRKLSSDEKKAVIYAWEASMGPKYMRKQLRSEYADEMKKTLSETMHTFEEELAPVREQLLNDNVGKEVAARPAVQLNVGEDELRHARFLDCSRLSWAVDRDLCAAARALEQVGAVTSLEGFIDLLANGICDFSPKPRRDVFVESTTEPADALINKRKYPKVNTLFAILLSLRLTERTKLSFWQGLVALWVLALHRQLESAFGSMLASVTSPGEVHPGPLKPLARILEKTSEYIEEKGLTSWRDRVLAPLYVIDILRATVQVPSVVRMSEVEAALTDRMALARTKNGHSLEQATSVGGYRDVKHNLVLRSDLAEPIVKGTQPFGPVALLCEVQVLLNEYKNVKLKMHAVYRVHRGDFGGMDRI